MTSVLSINTDKRSSKKGEEIKIPVTVLEVPEIKVLGIRAYKKDVYGLKPSFEVWADSIEMDLSKKIKLPKKKTEQHKLKELQEKLSEFYDLRVIVYTQPRSISLKKKPEVMEIGIGGTNINEKFDYAKTILGKHIEVSQVFKEGQLVDAHAVTTGKGFQGVIKRFGLKLKSHKAEKGRRRLGTLGNWSAKTWRVAHAGQMGYHLRTEYNKKIIRISSESENKITPKGGFVNYGQITNKYMLVAGSIPGPKKRLITFTTASRAHNLSQDAPEILNVSLISQQ